MRFRFFVFSVVAALVLALPLGARAGHYESVSVVNNTSRYVEVAAVNSLAHTMLSVCVAPKTSHTIIVGALGAVQSLRFEVKSQSSCQTASIWIRERALASKITLKEEKGTYALAVP